MMTREEEIRKLANGAWNKLNFALHLIHGNGPKDQLEELVTEAREACDMIVKGKSACQTCNKKPGEERVDNGLAAGCHCDECWHEMVSECRRQSW
jgi:hypothetical protein